MIHSMELIHGLQPGANRQNAFGLPIIKDVLVGNQYTWVISYIIVTDLDWKFNIVMAVSP